MYVAHPIMQEAINYGHEWGIHCMEFRLVDIIDLLRCITRGLCSMHEQRIAIQD